MRRKITKYDEILTWTLIDYRKKDVAVEGEQNMVSGFLGTSNSYLSTIARCISHMNQGNHSGPCIFHIFACHWLHYH